MQRAWDKFAERKHLSFIINICSSGVSAPDLVPLVKILITHHICMHLLHCFHLGLWQNKVVLEFGFEIGPSSVIDWVSRLATYEAVRNDEVVEVADYEQEG